MHANVKKTQGICFGANKKTPTRLTFLDESIPWQYAIKYLGLTIDCNLNMKKHVENICAQTRAATFALRPVLTSRLPLRTKVGVYKTYLRSRLTYAATAWYALTNEATKAKLRTRQSAALRLVVNAPRYVRNSTISRDLRIESTDDFIKQLATNFFARTNASLITHIRDIAPWHTRPPDGKKFPRSLAMVNNDQEED